MTKDIGKKTQPRVFNINNAILALILAANAVFLSQNSFKIFKFFDMGSFLDASWRVFLGQHPYVDFYTNIGPIHLYMNAFFFHIFGFGKTAILAHLITVHSIVIIATFLLMRRFTPLFITIIVTLITTSCYCWPLSHPWYTQSSYLWCFIASVYLLINLPFKDTRAAFLSAFVSGAAVVLSFMTKPNIGVGFGALFGFVFLISSLRSSTLRGYVSGILTMGVLSIPLIIKHPLEYINQTILLYGSGQSGRMLKLFWNPSAWFMNHYWLIALLVVLHIAIQRKIVRERAALFFGIGYVALFEITTSGAVWQCNNPLMGLFAGVAFIIFYNDSPRLNAAWRQITRSVFIGILALGSIALICVYTKYGVDVKGWEVPDRFVWGIPVDPAGTYPLKSERLKGWLTEKSQGNAVDELVEFINKNIPSDDSLMILTDLYILDALTGREPLRRMPSPFTIGVLPAPGKQLEDFRHRFLTDMPDWIVTHYGNVAHLSKINSYLGIKEALGNNYGRVMSAGNYLIIKRLTKKSDKPT